MQNTTKCWLWPDHTIGKRESRRLREKHNALVNLNDELLAVCKEIEKHLHPDGFKDDTARDYAWRLAQQAVANAERGSK